MVNAPGICERISNELRPGGKAAIIPRARFRARAVRMAGHRSLSAETIRARLEAAAAALALAILAPTPPAHGPA